MEQKLKVELSFTKSEWAMILLLMHHAYPYLPRATWESSEGVIDAIEQALSKYDPKEIKKKFDQLLEKTDSPKAEDE